MPVENLAIGETIVVKPGERIPMDGQILSGQSAVNQAPITGESQPVEKTAGEPVFAGSINGQGTLDIAVSHLAADNTISRAQQVHSTYHAELAQPIATAKLTRDEMRQRIADYRQQNMV